ncbi:MULTISPECIES: SRPBCC family protein [unclassified Streptomyces]|uniref:SRPBCC family protein n=1 Tax=unclassified Streptomyces TaxID=2593676 RepID=UPI002E224FFF|nr:SRPBCC family protein [Streptomyces sp. NBC_01023]
MTPTNTESPLLFDVRARIQIAATPAEVYAVVSDLPRSTEWSPECTGGAWVSGRPATVGAVFRGENLRADDVVAWAPVVRGTWRTESQVVAAEPGRVFRWAMRDSTGTPQDSVWSYEIAPDGDGCVLVHGLRMGTATEGIRGITAEMDEATRKKFFADWTEKLAGDLQVTLRRVKAIVEKA